MGKMYYCTEQTVVELYYTYYICNLEDPIIMFLILCKIPENNCSQILNS